MKRVLIIPAAGQGSRLGSQGPKPLVEVAGQPMLTHLLELYRGLVDRFIVVVNPIGRAEVTCFLEARCSIAEVEVQSQPTGALDAILRPRDRVTALAPEEVWVTWCDQVAVQGVTAHALAMVMGASPPPALAFPTWESEEPYIHFERDKTGVITGVRQRREGEAMPIRGEGDVGLFALRNDIYLTELPRYAKWAPSGPSTGERNFLPFIPWLSSRAEVATFPARHSIEAVGINTPDQLARVAAELKLRS